MAAAPVAASKGKGKGAAPPPPKLGASAAPKLKAKPFGVKLPQEGEGANLEAHLQARGEEMDKCHAMEMEGVDISTIDENAKEETFQCPRCEKEIRVSMRESHMSAHSAEILPWLFLGAARNADNGKELTVRTGITHILNVAHETNQDHDARAEWQAYNKERGWPCEYTKFSWYDAPDQDIIKEMSGPVQFLRQAHEASADHRVLVHCVQGISRSASVVIFYLMVHERMSLRAAFELAKSRRPLIEPRLEFLRQLGEFECKHFSLDRPTLVADEVYAGRTLLNLDDPLPPRASQAPVDGE
mmetsp:Transcript_38601/g.110955  ORF Transcript_38601/g.110955 Transcript_38601/m.110955 type:complete len:300 (+) Transcript_38601:73-972(+)